MPFKSEKQRRYIFLAASNGEAWAIKYLKDMGLKPPKIRVKRKG